MALGFRKGVGGAGGAAALYAAARPRHAYLHTDKGRISRGWAHQEQYYVESAFVRPPKEPDEDLDFGIQVFAKPRPASPLRSPSPSPQPAADNPAPTHTHTALPVLWWPPGSVAGSPPPAKTDAPGDRTSPTAPVSSGQPQPQQQAHLQGMGGIHIHVHNNLHPAQSPTKWQEHSPNQAQLRSPNSEGHAVSGAAHSELRPTVYGINPSQVLGPDAAPAAHGSSASHTHAARDNLVHPGQVSSADSWARHEGGAVEPGRDVGPGWRPAAGGLVARAIDFRALVPAASLAPPVEVYMAPASPLPDSPGVATDGTMPPGDSMQPMLVQQEVLDGLDTDQDNVVIGSRNSTATVASSGPGGAGSAAPGVAARTRRKWQLPPPGTKYLATLLEGAYELEITPAVITLRPSPGPSPVASPRADAHGPGAPRPQQGPSPEPEQERAQEGTASSGVFAATDRASAPVAQTKPNAMEPAGSSTGEGSIGSTGSGQPPVQGQSGHSNALTEGVLRKADGMEHGGKGMVHKAEEDEEEQRVLLELLEGHDLHARGQTQERASDPTHLRLPPGLEGLGRDDEGDVAGPMPSPFAPTALAALRSSAGMVARTSTEALHDLEAMMQRLARMRRNLVASKAASPAHLAAAAAASTARSALTAAAMAGYGAEEALPKPSSGDLLQAAERSAGEPGPPSIQATLAKAGVSATVGVGAGATSAVPTSASSTAALIQAANARRAALQAALGPTPTSGDAAVSGGSGITFNPNAAAGPSWASVNADPLTSINRRGNRLGPTAPAATTGSAFERPHTGGRALGAPGSGIGRAAGLPNDRASGESGFSLPVWPQVAEAGGMPGRQAPVPPPAAPPTSAFTLLRSAGGSSQPARQSTNISPPPPGQPGSHLDQYPHGAPRPASNAPAMVSAQQRPASPSAPADNISPPTSRPQLSQPLQLPRGFASGRDDYAPHVSMLPSGQHAAGATNIAPSSPQASPPRRTVAADWSVGALQQRATLWHDTSSSQDLGNPQPRYPYQPYDQPQQPWQQQQVAAGVEAWLHRGPSSPQGRGLQAASTLPGSPLRSQGRGSLFGSQGPGSPQRSQGWGAESMQRLAQALPGAQGAWDCQPGGAIEERVVISRRGRYDSPNRPDDIGGRSRSTSPSRQARLPLAHAASPTRPHSLSPRRGAQSPLSPRSGVLRYQSVASLTSPLTSPRAGGRYGVSPPISPSTGGRCDGTSPTRSRYRTTPSGSHHGSLAFGFLQSMLGSRGRYSSPHNRASGRAPGMGSGRYDGIASPPGSPRSPQGGSYSSGASLGPGSGPSMALQSALQHMASPRGSPQRPSTAVHSSSAVPPLHAGLGGAPHAAHDVDDVRHTVLEFQPDNQGPARLGTEGGAHALGQVAAGRLDGHARLAGSDTQPRAADIQYQPAKESIQQASSQTAGIFLHPRGSRPSDRLRRLGDAEPLSQTSHQVSSNRQGTASATGGHGSAAGTLLMLAEVVGHEIEVESEKEQEVLFSQALQQERGPDGSHGTQQHERKPRGHDGTQQQEQEEREVVQEVLLNAALQRGRGSVDLGKAEAGRRDCDGASGGVDGSDGGGSRRETGGVRGGMPGPGAQGSSTIGRLASAWLERMFSDADSD